VVKYREQLEGYIADNPAFLTSLEPLPSPESAPDIVKKMIDAGRRAGVGPMAAVAGAMAEYVGADLLEFSPEIIVENGGDIFIKSRVKRVIGIYAGGSPLSGKIGLEVSAGDTPLGICTSSGMVGHSLSYGQADAVVVLAKSAALADAAATSIGNRVKTGDDIGGGIDFSQNIGGLKGVVIIKDDRIGIFGEVKLCETSV
jgi:ApbE superfamily uncharacterized protein (UPF0280 family)